MAKEKEAEITQLFRTLVSQVAAEPSRRRILAGSALLAAGLTDWLAGGALDLIYSIPVAVAALLEGKRGGAAAVFLSAVGLFALSPSHAVTWKIVELAALSCLAGLVDFIAAGERRQRRHYQQAAEQLSRVYKKVQANFEGMKRVERLSALGQLSAGLAHEIRNPLASISGAAAILSRSPGLDAKNAKCLEIITSESQRLNGLLTNFLNFARPRPPRLQPVLVEPVLEKVLGLASHGVSGKTVHFEKEIAPGLPSVECDPEQLEQVLLNLMINAIDASPDGGTVTLSAAVKDGAFAIGVLDHGHGVAPGHIDRLFDPFFTTKEHGTGLGLPVAHQIVRQMGGTLLARVNAAGGMTFSVVLPAEAQDS